MDSENCGQTRDYPIFSKFGAKRIPISLDEIIVFGVLILAFVMFVMGTWRYDIVAFFALLALTFVGIVPAAEAFKGFGHPAVVTVAGVLVLTRALQNSGVVDVNAAWYSRVPDRSAARVLSLSGITAFLFGFHELRRGSKTIDAGGYQSFESQ